MITGYNTDVRHQDVVFHVQTEDKGEGNPYIESLVYVGGQVLAARRSDYKDLLETGGGEKAVLAKMEKQHRAMIAAIRRGKLDGRMAELLGGGTASGDGTAGTGIANSTGTTAAPPLSHVGGPGDGDATTARPLAARGTGTAPAAAGVDAEGDRTLDQVILDYLSSEAEQEHLELRIAGEPMIEVGSSASIELHTVSSKSSSPVPGAQVVVRMISTVAEPRTLTSGTTDPEGRLALQFEVPDLGRGTTALIINASSNLGRAELKQLL